MLSAATQLLKANALLADFKLRKVLAARYGQITRLLPAVARLVGLYNNQPSTLQSAYLKMRGIDASISKAVAHLQNNRRCCLSAAFRRLARHRRIAQLSESQRAGALRASVEEISDLEKQLASKRAMLFEKRSQLEDLKSRLLEKNSILARNDVLVKQNQEIAQKTKRVAHPQQLEDLTLENAQLRKKHASMSVDVKSVIQEVSSLIDHSPSY